MSNTDRVSCDVEGCEKEPVADLVGEEDGVRCLNCLMLDLELKRI